MPKGTISNPDNSPESRQPVLCLRGITKSFPAVQANNNIDLDVYSGEVHALLGENGAGKSVLMKILYGFYRADHGKILMDGTPVSIQSPFDARKLGIGMVFQDLNLIPVFTVAENIALFMPGLKAVPNLDKIKDLITGISDHYSFKVNPNALVSQISIGDQQKVEILKLLLADARLLILDEPTRVLAPHEVEALYNILDNLRKDGYAIILITHKMKEVLRCADRISVLRGGRLAGTMRRSEASEEKLIKLMFEKELSSLQTTIVKPSSKEGQPLFELRNVATPYRGTSSCLKDISLRIYNGEIVGIAGVSGNGQKELCDFILGMEPCLHGQKFLNGADITNLSIREIRRKGVAFVPENPLSMASVPFMTVLENMTLTSPGLYQKHCGLSMDWPAVRNDLLNTEKKLGFSVPMYALARSLSGGNLQRMVILRELSHDPGLIITSYLTRGLDMQSTIAARQAIVDAGARGTGILLVSEDLDELFALSNRLLVLRDGKIAGEFTPSETNFFEIGHLMTGTEVSSAAKN